MWFRKLDKIKSNIKEINSSDKINIIAVSKTFSIEQIKPLIEEYGHIHFVNEGAGSSFKMA